MGEFGWFGELVSFDGLNYFGLGWLVLLVLVGFVS